LVKGIQALAKIESARKTALFNIATPQLSKPRKNPVISRVNLKNNYNFNEFRSKATPVILSHTPK